MPGGDPLGEVVALEELGDGQRAGEPDDVGERQLGQPFAVVAHLGPFFIEDLERLLEVRLRVCVDLLVRQDRPLR